MSVRLKISVAALALFTIGTPVAAQAEEQPQTTDQLIFVKLKPSPYPRWRELFEKYFAPAQAASDIPADEVHEFNSGHWDLMIKTEMLEGLAGQDTHGSPYRAAFMAKAIELAGSMEQLLAIGEEMDAMVVDRERYFTHTHP